MSRNLNPADFLLEIATNDYGPQNYLLAKKIANGKNKSYRRNSEVNMKMNYEKLSIVQGRSSSTFFRQFCQLMLRNFLILKRDPSPIIIRFLINFVVGLLVGTIYIGNGNDASQIFSVFKYIFVSVFFLMYTSYYSLQTACK